MDECYNCMLNDEDYGCTCSHSEKWYSCPIENKKPENILALKEYAAYLDALKEHALSRSEE